MATSFQTCLCRPAVSQQRDMPLSGWRPRLLLYLPWRRATIWPQLWAPDPLPSQWHMPEWGDMRRGTEWRQPVHLSLPKWLRRATLWLGPQCDHHRTDSDVISRHSDGSCALADIYHNSGFGDHWYAYFRLVMLLRVIMIVFISTFGSAFWYLGRSCSILSSSKFKKILKDSSGIMLLLSQLSWNMLLYSESRVHWHSTKRMFYRNSGLA